MTKQIKVLDINYDSNEFNGVAIFLMNVYRNIDHNKIQIDFLTPDTSSYNSSKYEIESTGGSIFEFHVNFETLKGKRTFAERLRMLLTEHSYDIVHINSGSLSLNCISAIIAKSKNIKVIAHSHNTGDRGWWKNFFSSFLKLILQKNADVLCACSEAAARHLFTKSKVDNGEVIIIKNGIDLHKFQYNEKIRNKIREELNLEGHFVIGHIGRFEEQKNHRYLIDIFSEILQKEPSAVLLLIGQGALESEICEKIKDLNIEKNVIFLGARDDVDKFYQVMDVFLFPSLFEGLPISLIEAQTSGLPCVISNTITKEVDVTRLIHRVSLQDPVQKWANEVLSVIMDNDNRDFYEREIKEAGYGIEDVAKKISKIYEKLMRY